jgi:hypothetical protein
MWSWPILLYRVRQSSIQSECAAVYAGMTLSEVEELVHSKAWPTEESFSKDVYSFGRWEVCQVEVEPLTKKVKRAQMFHGSVQ